MTTPQPWMDATAVARRLSASHAARRCTLSPEAAVERTPEVKQEIPEMPPDAYEVKQEIPEMPPDAYVKVEEM